MPIGLYWWVRRPASRFGPLLIVFGVLRVADQLGGRRTAPLPFDIGVLSEGPVFGSTFYLFLAFPMGRLEPAAARWLMAPWRSASSASSCRGRCSRRSSPAAAR